MSRVSWPCEHGMASLWLADCILRDTTTQLTQGSCLALRSRHVSPHLQAQATSPLLTGDPIRGEDISGQDPLKEAWGTEQWKTLKDLWFSEVYRRAELLSGLCNTCVWSRRVKSRLVM